MNGQQPALQQQQAQAGQQPQILAILPLTISQNPTDQQQALQYLRQACEQNYPEFAHQLATVLANDQHVPYVRQAAGLQLKNTLAAKDPGTFDVFKRRWLSLPDDVRLHVKDCVMRTLGTEARPSTAAQCIAAIACIELPENKWPEVIDALMTNVTNPASAEMVKEASLEALGYICQDAPVAVLEEKSNVLLTAIVFGMRTEASSMHIRLAATNAMLNALEFSRRNFENENERNVIMEVVCTSTQVADNHVKISALQCLVKIMSLYYQLTERYIEALFTITVHAMKAAEDEVVLQGIEFWSNVCEEEMTLQAEAEEAQEKGETPTHVSRHYAKGAIPYILPILTEQLAKQEEDADEDEWVPPKAAGVCVMLLAQCCGDPVVDAILPFITQHFTSTDWHYREAAIMAFGSILEGPSKPKLMALGEQAIQPLIVTMGDSNAAVKDTAAWAIGRVCDSCEELVTREDVLKALLPALFTALHDQPRVAANACWAISSLVRAAYQVAMSRDGTNVEGHLETSILSPVFETMVTELLKTTERPDAGTANLRIAAYEALMELVKNSASDCYPIVQRTTMHILQKLESLLGVEDALVSSADRQQLRDLQSQLCATLQSVLNKIHKEDAPLVSDAIMAGLLQIMQRCFGRDGGAVVEEAMMAVSSLIDLLGAEFNKYLLNFKPYLFHVLDAHEDSQVCIAAVGVVSDLCRALEVGLAPHMDEIMAKLIGILDDPKVKRLVKSAVLNCFGDVALALNSGYERYLPTTMKWISEAITAAQITNPDDLDQVDYVETLRENCCTAFTGIVQGLCRDDAGRQLFLPYHNAVWHLVFQIATAQPASTDSLCASGLALVGDMLATYGAVLLQVVESEQVNQLLVRCRRSKNNKSKTTANWVGREVARVKRSMNEGLPA